MNLNLHDIRRDYSQKELSVSDCLADPFLQFELWLNEAVSAQVLEPTAMNIATVDGEGKPSSRIVLLKEVSEKGFVFFTNYYSRKGKSLEKNTFCALNFFWPELERQVRIEGIVEKLNQQDSDEYFNSRPYKSKIGAWASKQSQILDSKVTLLKRFALLSAKFSFHVNRPDFWGGYLVKPNYFEFWQGRPSRMHDRVFYQRDEHVEDNIFWKIGLLSP